MKDLPSEILGEIFLYLHPQNKVECMLVCQHWKQVIEQFALYHVLDILSADNLNRLIELVKGNPEIGKRVEHLRVHFYDEFDDFNSNEFLLLLPNIRTILCTGPEWTLAIISKGIVYPWSRHIQYINEHSNNSITCSLLLSNICPNLTRIVLDDSYGNIIPLLKNAPALRHLTLRVGRMTLDDVETIHEYAPYLESFTTRRLYLMKSELHQDVNPAISINECHFDDTMMEETSEGRVALLLYAAKKYPNLSIFSFNFIWDYRINDRAEKLTNADWLPLVQNLGSRLKKLSFCAYGCVDDIFDILDRFNCQLDYLKTFKLSDTAFTKLAKSQQIVYIQTLTVHDTFFQDYTWLNGFQALKKLKIFCMMYREHAPEIALNAIIDHSPPTLRSLSLRRFQLILDPKYTGLSTIKSLSFGNMHLPKDIDAFITRHFPKLSKLRIKRCFVVGGLMNLEKLNLLSFSYVTLRDSEILIVTTGTKERRWYSLRDSSQRSFGISKDNSHHNFYPSVKSRPQNETDIEPQFTLVCNSLNSSMLI